MSVENRFWQEKAYRVVKHWGTTTPLHGAKFTPALVSVDGRPLLESESPYNPARIVFEFKPVPHEDRQGKEADFDAYRTVMGDYSEVLENISYLRSVIHPYRRRPTLEGITTVMSAAFFLPDYLVMRARDPMKNGEIPTALASTSKVARGFIIPLGKEVIKPIVSRYAGTNQRQNSSFITNVDAFLEHLYAEQLLHSSKEHKEGLACPVSDAVLTRTVDVLLNQPVEGFESAEARLSLSRAEVRKLATFASALHTALREEEVFKDYQSKIDPSRFARLEQTYTTIIANNERIANRALGRTG